MKNYTHISKNEREQIFLLLNQGKSFRNIGKVLNRHHETISREIERNGLPNEVNGQEKYSPSLAESLSKERRRNSKDKKLDESSLRSLVIKKLGKGWSPEQIAGRLKLTAPNCYVSAESIYKFIYHKENRSLKLWEFLRKGHSKRQGLFSRKVKIRKNLAIPNKTPIERRPEEANLRSKVGHLESDLMEGSHTSKDTVSVTIDRKALAVYLDKLPNKEAKIRAEGLNERLNKLPFSLQKTVTLDNGSENAHHEKITKEHGTRIYFCNPYHSWEKGTVENTIGLVRQYVPKGTNLSEVTQGDLNTIAWELNNRPRKKLGFYTPSEMVYKEVGWITSN